MIYPSCWGTGPMLEPKTTGSTMIHPPSIHTTHESLVVQIFSRDDGKRDHWITIVRW